MSSARRRHVVWEAGLGHPQPSPSHDGHSGQVALILRRIGDVERKIGRLLGDRDNPALEDLSSRCADAMNSCQTDPAVGRAQSPGSGGVQCGWPLSSSALTGRHPSRRIRSGRSQRRSPPCRRRPDITEHEFGWRSGVARVWSGERMGRIYIGSGGQAWPGPT